MNNQRLTGSNFNELYVNKRSLNRVPNHEGIKKIRVSSGSVRKNTVKVYHYEPINCEKPKAADKTEPIEDKPKAKKLEPKGNEASK